ncbi:MAG: UvrB/UvrC motif-containing protein [Phycisphaerae bacterium]|nr:UvrB/UvrC motif-containing protein [Phycisphaerae bacterium]
MICQSCKEKTATVHLTEITNGQRSERHLCQECAQQHGLAVKTQIPLNELLSTLLSAGPQAGEGSSSPASDRACPVCGMTLKRFSKETLLGCSHDYEEFGQELMPLIEQTQNGKHQHCGKVPSRRPQEDQKNVALNNLHHQLEAAVKNEDYETAARLRDQIKSYE